MPVRYNPQWGLGGCPVLRMQSPYVAGRLGWERGVLKERRVGGTGAAMGGFPDPSLRCLFEDRAWRRRQSGFKLG